MELLSPGLRAVPLCFKSQDKEKHHQGLLIIAGDDAFNTTQSHSMYDFLCRINQYSRVM